MLIEPARADGSKRNKRKIDPLRELETTVAWGIRKATNSQSPPKDRTHWCSGPRDVGHMPP